jgi:hypothetical protein
MGGIDETALVSAPLASVIEWGQCVAIPFRGDQSEGVAFQVVL